MICRLALAVGIIWTVALTAHTIRMLTPELVAWYAEWPYNRKVGEPARYRPKGTRPLWEAK